MLDAFSTYYPESIESLPSIRRAFMNLLSIHPGHSESILTYLPFFTGDGFVYIQLAAIGDSNGVFWMVTINGLTNYTYGT